MRRWVRTQDLLDILQFTYYYDEESMQSISGPTTNRSPTNSNDNSTVNSRTTSTTNDISTIHGEIKFEKRISALTTTELSDLRGCIIQLLELFLLSDGI